MAKNFTNARIGSIIQIENPEYNAWFHPSTIAKFDDYTAVITNIEIYGDELIISFRNTKFNHTVKVYKNATKGYVRIHQKKWHNHRTSWNKHTKRYLYDLTIKNSSEREYRQTDKYNYYYTFSLL